MNRETSMLVRRLGWDRVISYDRSAVLLIGPKVLHRLTRMIRVWSQCAIARDANREANEVNRIAQVFDFLDYKVYGNSWRWTCNKAPPF
jgi:hypothetical protein